MTIECNDSDILRDKQTSGVRTDTGRGTGDRNRLQLPRLGR
jgi:hypothetical protein